jgi:hypothetical protein
MRRKGLWIAGCTLAIACGTKAADDLGATGATDAGSDASSTSDGSVGDGGSGDAASADASDGAPQTPAVLTSLGGRLRLWLDATDTSTLSLDAGARVDGWTDKSPTRFVARPPVGFGPDRAPTYTTDTDAGGARAVAFGNQTYLTIADSGALDFASTAFEAWVVARVLPIPPAENNLISKRSISPGGYALTVKSGVNPAVCSYLATGTCVPATIDLGVFTFALSGLDAGAQSLVASKLGQDASAPLLENVSPTVADFEVGATQSGSLTLNGNIFEVLIVAEPTDPERAAIATYLKAKYGLP